MRMGVQSFWLPAIAVATKGISRRRKQFWRGGQVPVGFFFIEVTQIDGQVWQPGTDIQARSVPRQQPSDGESVPERV
jgi:hypothetical protein